ncbi:PAS domain S-box-containing protein [Roseateles sp. YR242]|uniref:hybrid sensor histidine kinase/response regulator n=1 Tax=Roseateles sp. YR242 TaxID=1855305 RepID=UPI0008CF0A70|nr:ATP-binding protein [Roseateles sp. YR242]SEK61454.1 PAS domain S-box-containing protein [Roseateles sp. YR242]
MLTRVVPGDPRVLTALLDTVANTCGATACELVWDGQVVASGHGIAPEITAALDVRWDHVVAQLRVMDPEPRQLSRDERRAFRSATVCLQAYLVAAASIQPISNEARLSDKLQAALEYLSDALILLGRDGVVEFVNSAFEEATARSRYTLLGRPYWECFPASTNDRRSNEARAALQAGRSYTFEEYVERLEKWFEFRAFPCSEGAIVLLIDITTRKADETARVQLEEKLMRAQRMESLGTLAGGIAHDFNNILAAILGHAGMVADESSPDSPLRDHMDQIRRAGSRARELVQRILAFARGGGEEFCRQPLTPLVSEAVDLLKATLPPSVRLEVDLGDDNCAATVSPSEVQQMVMNLCTNAWQSMEGGQGTIRILLRCVTVQTPRVCTIGQLAPTQYAELCVEDDGAGMPESVKQRLFEPFFTTKPRGQGTGLGLHVLHGIVDLHSGAIDVRSNEGAGTRFMVFLPVVEAEGPVKVEALHQAMRPGHGEPVAYVDDDPIVLMMVEQLLIKAGFLVSVFGSPEEFLTVISANPQRFQVLVTDFNMPNMNGAELAVAVRSLNPELPIVVTTGFISDELEATAETLGRMAVLQKERSYEELAELIALAVQGFPESRFGDTGLATL